MTNSSTASESEPEADFPLRFAQTGRFRRGLPHSCRPLPGGRVIFLRSASGRSAVGDLWLLDVATGQETLLVNADSLAAAEHDLPAAELARRERMRLSGSGITAFDVDDAGAVAVFGHAGRLFTTQLPQVANTDQLAAHSVHLLDVPGPVVDPRVAPDASAVSWHAQGRLWVSRLDGSQAAAVTPTDGATWGLADFIAAEEFDRMRGHWWAPDSRTLLVARVDDSGVNTWWLSNPAQPDLPPVAHSYPAAGTRNAAVSLWLVTPGGQAGSKVVEVGESAPYEYLGAVRWAGGDALAMLLSRDQRECAVLAISATGMSKVVARWRDDCWVDVVAGTPRWLANGALVTVRRDSSVDRMRVFLDDRPVSPADVQVRAVIGTLQHDLVITAATTPEASDILRLVTDSGYGRLVPTGVGTGHWSSGVAGHGLVVGTGAGPRDDTWHVEVASFSPPLAPVPITDHCERSGIAPLPTLHRVGNVRYAILFPTQSGSVGLPAKLPILMRPYGGPHSQHVMIARPAYVEAQWWADQGYVVIIADGRGTPGVSPSYERAVHGDLAGPPLADQLLALDDALANYPDRLDPDRVGISGWSFGGFLSALAVLARPDRFAAAVAGAPVTDWARYDTAYTERYLGDPTENRNRYVASGLLQRAAELQRPLLLIHGMSDDNVFAAHTLALSDALVSAGRSHCFVPLSGVTHMTPQPEIAASVLRLQTDFFATQLQGTRRQPDGA